MPSSSANTRVGRYLSSRDLREVHTNGPKCATTDYMSHSTRALSSLILKLFIHFSTIHATLFEYMYNLRWDSDRWGYVSGLQNMASHLNWVSNHTFGQGHRVLFFGYAQKLLFMVFPITTVLKFISAYRRYLAISSMLKVIYLTEPAEPTDQCPHQFGYFKLGDTRNCSHFRNCVNGVGHDFTCPEGLAFDPETYRCEWPDQASDCDAEG